MADSKLSALPENTAPLGSDSLYDVQSSGPTSTKILAGNYNLLPSGYMVNGKISVTVTSNNITVALKTLSGGNPSATDPVSIWINGSFRRCTAALSVTKNAGTNWCNAGGAELATFEIDYFVYLIWNTGPNPDAVDIGFSRIPFGRLYSDFSSTTTNEKYLAYGNGSAPSSTDDLCVIGRFAATLSAGAGYTWTVPTFTNANLIHHTIFETRDLSCASVSTGFSADYSRIVTYQVIDRAMYYSNEAANAGTSNATGFTLTMPFSAKIAQTFPILAADNGALQFCIARTVAGSATLTLCKGPSITAASWTGSGNKYAQFEQIILIG